MIVKPEAWLSEPDENEKGLLDVWVIGEAEFPMLVETHNVSATDITLNQPQNFTFIYECVVKPDVYESEDLFYKFGVHASMAAESVIPVGLFSSTEDSDFVQTPCIILNGKVIATYDNPTLYGFDEGDILFTLYSLGNEYDVVLYSNTSEGLEIHNGNIISGVLYVQGWPTDDAEYYI